MAFPTKITGASLARSKGVAGMVGSRSEFTTGPTDMLGSSSNWASGRIVSYSWRSKRGFRIIAISVISAMRIGAAMRIGTVRNIVVAVAAIIPSTRKHVPAERT